MTSLVKVLRDLLANMEEEHHSLLMQNATAFEWIMNQRLPLMNSMHHYKKVMMNEIDKLQEKTLEFSEIEDDRDKLLNLANLIGEEKIELLILRDQILALMDKMDIQNECTNYLLGNNNRSDEGKGNYTHQYKPVKRRLQPKKSPSTQKKLSVKTLEMAPEEL